MKINTGDIFSLELDNNMFIYFQFLGKDNYQLGSDCIAVFNHTGTASSKPDYSEIISSGLWLITLTWIKYGIRDNLYQKVCNSPVIQDLSLIKFKNYQKNFYDEKKGLREVYYLRGFNNDTFVEYGSRESYVNNTKDAWDDGAMLAQGLRDMILEKLYN